MTNQDNHPENALAFAVVWCASVIGAILLYLFLASSAGAVDFEIEIGKDKFQETPNGVWYQKGFPYNWQTNSSTYKLGISDYIYPDIRYHLGVTDLGTVSMQSYATPSDANYNGVNGCVGKCWPLAYIAGTTSVKGIYGMLAPEFTFGENKFFVELGGIYFHMSSSINGDNIVSCQTCAPFSHTFNYSGGNQFDPIIGIGWQYKKVQFVLERIGTKIANSPNYEPAMGDYTLNAGIRYLF